MTKVEKLILIILLLIAMPAFATQFPIALSKSTLNTDLRTWSSGATYSGFMSGTQNFGGVTFRMLSNDSGKNIIWATTTNVWSLGSSTYSNTVTIDTSIYGASTVYTLINTAFATNGQTVGSVTFNASDGTTYSVNLVVGTNVRDHYFGSGVSATYVTKNVIGVDAGAHLDMQAFALPASFLTKTLSSIVFTTTGNTTTGIPFLAGVTVDGSTQNTATTNVTVNAYGSGTQDCALLFICTPIVYPTFDLYINGVKIGSTQTVTGSSANYTFSGVSLPTSGPLNIDIQFTNDLYCSLNLFSLVVGCNGDRNLYVNSITVGNITLTPSGKTIDVGSSYIVATDGTTTYSYSTMLYENSALRLDTSYASCCSTTSTLIAYYKFEETSWNGTLNEVKDTAGYSGGPYDGQGIGTPKPTPATASPARAGAAGTCGYATFGGTASGGSAFTMDNLPVNTSNGAKTTVSFWMYWDGTDSLQPIGWNMYNLWFTGGKFGFNTGGNDLWGTSSTGLANGWHHVVAIFANGTVSNSKLYIDGTLKTLTQTLTPTNSDAYVTTTLQPSGWTYDSNWRFPGGRIDELKVYNGEISSTQVTADYTATHACAGASQIPSNFNCVVVGANGATGKLYTQLVGTSFNIDVVALKADNTTETNFVTSGTKNVTLEIVDGSGSTACASRAALSPTVSQTVSFAVSDAGRKTASITISKAYRDLVCRVTDANQSSSVVACSSDDFSVRPSSFTVTAVGSADADNTGVSTTATPRITASSNPNFTLTATTSVAGYDGTPQIDNTKLSAHTGAIQAGTLSGSFSAANSATGNATASVGYSEVGYFRFAKDGVIDTSFTAVDSASGDCTLDSSNTLVGGEYGCYISNQSSTNFFGRFIPKYFNVDDASVTSSNACSSFTYYGQDGFNTQFILRAQNESGVRTRNYHGSYAKLDINTWTDNTASTGLKFLATNLPSGVNLLAGSSTPTGSWSQGQATISATHRLSRPTSAVGPVNLILQTNPVDSDGVIVINNTPEAANIPANSVFRYGRLWIPNQYGSELLNLTVPIEAQYWDSSSYHRNQSDSCTVIAPANIAMANYKGNLAACETVISGGGTMASGKTTMTLSKPGNGNNGSVDLSLNLNSAAGSTCTSSTASSATNANLPQFGTSNPTARETFGLFKSPVIYMRENH